MSWISYLVFSIVVFVAIAIVLAFRSYFGERLEELEEAEQRDDDERTTAESNSGL